MKLPPQVFGDLVSPPAIALLAQAFIPSKKFGIFGCAYSSLGGYSVVNGK